MAGVETRSKKKPLSPSPHKIGMVEKQTPSSSDKRKLERADKKGSPSPLRRSGRIEKNGFSSSSSSKKSSNSSSSQGNKNKEENIEKLKAADADEQSNSNEADTKSGGSSSKRKRLDFRSYRSFLMPQVKRAKCSEGQKHQKEDDASQDDTVNSGANDLKEVQDGRAYCQLKKVHELKPSGQCCDDLVEGSNSVSTHALENKNQKIFSNGTNMTKDEHNSFSTKCNDSSSQSSPETVATEQNHDTTTESMIDGEGDKIAACQLSSKELRALEPVESPCEEPSPAVYDASGMGDADYLASKFGTAPLNAENSVRDSIEHIASLSPSGIKSISDINMEQNTWCCELQRSLILLNYNNDQKLRY